LGFDSVYLVMAIEEEFRIEIPDADVAPLATVRQMTTKAAAKAR